MVHPFVVEGKVTPEHQNQSLPGLIERMCTHSPSFSTYDDKGQYVPLEYHNLLDLGHDGAKWLVKGCVALFALALVWSCRTPTEPRGGWRLSAEFGLILLGMLLFSERTWKHHCVTLLLPFGVLCYHLATRPSGWGLRVYLALTLAAAGGLMVLTSTGVGDGDEALSAKFGKLAQVYGAYVGAYVVLVAALVAALRTRDAATSAAAAPPAPAARAA
jgi:hypothetical protein